MIDGLAKTIKNMISMQLIDDIYALARMTLISLKKGDQLWKNSGCQMGWMGTFHFQGICPEFKVFHGRANHEFG